MNILFIHEVDWLKKVVFDVHLLAEAMSLQGHQVYALYYQSMWKAGDEVTPREFIFPMAIPETKVHLICPSYIRIPALSRASAFVTHYYEIKRIIKEKHIDAIVLYSVPTNGLQAVHWARKYNIPIVFRSIDVLSQLVPYPVLRPITRWMEKRVYSSVDRILTITPKLSEYVIGLGAESEKVGVLPMTVDTNRFRPMDKSVELMQKWGLSPTDKVILFMGTLFNFCGLAGFLREFLWLATYRNEVKLMIVGDGEMRPELEQMIKDWELGEHVIITGFQPYWEMPQYINLADVCVNTFERNKVTKDIFPGKTVQYLACGKPVVMRPLDGVKAVIEGKEQGVVYADNDALITSRAFQLIDNPDKKREIGDNGLRYAREFHSHEKVAKQLEAELVALIKGKRDV
jgi:glycosyltransferase involved in cell wall biosynthesis